MQQCGSGGDLKSCCRCEIDEDRGQGRFSSRCPADDYIFWIHGQERDESSGPALEKEGRKEGRKEFTHQLQPPRPDWMY